MKKNKIPRLSIFIFVIVFLALLSGCDVELDENGAATQFSYCDDTPNITVEDFPIINPNYCLNSPLPDMLNIHDIQQEYFTNFSTYSLDIDGHGKRKGDPGSTADYVFMQTTQGWWEAFIQGTAGYWGLSQELHLDNSCYGLKLKGRTDINDRYHPINYTISANVYYPDIDELPLNLGVEPVPLHGDVNSLFTFYIETPQTVVVSGYYIALFGDAGENSTVGLSDFQILELPDGYCGR